MTETTFIISAKWDVTWSATNSGGHQGWHIMFHSCHWVNSVFMNMIWVNSMFMKLQFKPKCQEPGQVCNARSIGGGGCLLQFSDLPPCRWLPLFAHSVNYYQKAVYLGCSPTLLHILWPIIKGDLHYKPWSPSKRATATVSAARPIPAPQHYLSTPSCFVSPIALSLSLPPSLSPYLLLLPFS